MGICNFVSLKYFYSKSKLNIINFISAIASFVLVVAACSFFIVLSVFSGLKDFGLQYNRSFDPDLMVSHASGGFFELTETHLKKLENSLLIFSSVFEEKVLLSSDGKNTFGTIIGVDNNYRSVIEIDNLIALGRWLDPETSESVVSYSTANKLNLGLFEYGNSLTVSVPATKPRSGFNKSLFESSSFMASGIFNSSDEKDQRIVFSSLKSVQNLFQKNTSVVTSLLVKTSDLKSTKTILKNIFGDQFMVQSREELNKTYYKMINSEGLVLNLIMGLILIVAMFNSVGAIIILIVEKQSSIRTLIKLGATESQIQNIFFCHGVLISVFGGGVGLLAGLLFVWLQKTYSLITLSGTSIPYPVGFEFSNVLTVFLFLTIICGTGSYLASRRSLKVKLQE
ncbi:FtsX-like permease family protein [Flavobacteriaceae bacterium]|jgi:lipoprotein-releasing system permease protein|nr:FtsX-like permease family protein [Flavobacteriaceae bacterium]MDC3245997.1 FtsX-like permease family protein [Flavobacteriaceae bacterium]